MSKKTIIVVVTLLLFIILVATFAFSRGNGGLSGFFGGSAGGGTFGGTLPGGNDATTTPPGGGGAPDDYTGTAPLIITEDAVASATVNAEGDAVLYIRKDNGHIYRINFDGGNPTRISNRTIPAVTNTMWSADKSRALITFYENGNRVRFFSARLTDTGALDGVLLPEEAFAGDIAPNGNAIFYAVPEGTGSALITATPTGENQKRIATIPFMDIVVRWITDTALGVAQKSTSDSPAGFFTVSLSGIPTLAIPPERGLSVLAHPDGTRVLFSRIQSGKRTISLAIRDLRRNETLPVNLSTLPEKCAWARLEDALYCAVPKTPPLNLPEAWWKGDVTLEDGLIKIDASTGAIIDLWKGDGLDATKLFLDQTESYLFLINKNGSELWSLKLNI